MTHLTREELVDAAEGTRAEASLPHLASCATCRAELNELRVMMSSIADVDVPEPSPLFWDHLSGAVRDAVAAETNARQSWWRNALAHLLRPAIAIPIAAASVLAVLLVVMAGGRATVAVPVPQPAESAAPAEAVDGTAMLPPDDPALDMVADLGTGLDWDAVHDSGIVAHAGLVDRAVSGLSAGERAELGRLLKQELSGGGD